MCRPNNRAFESFVAELGQVTAPRLWAPAATAGRVGFEVALGHSSSFVSDAPHWRLTDQGQATNRPTGDLHALHLALRKGLPGAFEVQAQLTWLLDSEMVTPSLELRWAFLQNAPRWPDLALRTAVGTLLGARNLSLTTWTTDILASRAFTVASTWELTPFMGFGLVLLDARSDVVDPTPGVLRTGADGQARPDRENDLVFDPVTLGERVDPRLTLGVQGRYRGLLLSVQGDLQLFSEGQFVGPVSSLSTQLGLQF